MTTAVSSSHTNHGIGHAAATGWSVWAAGGQNSGLGWQTGAGDSGPSGGDDFAGAESWAKRFRSKFPAVQHIDIWTSFMVHKNVNGVINRIESKQPALQRITNANIRICQTFPILTEEDQDDPDKVIHGNRKNVYVKMYRDFAPVFKNVGAR